MTAYAGNVQVEDQCFAMSFERLILREEELAFSIGGEDEDGQFNLEGAAKEIVSGQFQANAHVAYSDYMDNGMPYTEPAVIIIDQVIESPSRKTCKVKGRWKQDRDTWSFSGVLKKFKR